MYIGLDIGTSGTKASLIDENGIQIEFKQENYGFSNTENGCRELNAENVWEAVRHCLEAVGSGREVRTITVSAMGESIIPIDKDGNPLYASITGTDMRGGEQLSVLVAMVGEKRITDITGLNLSIIYSANKIMWIKENKKLLYEKAWKFVTYQDFIVYKLTHQAYIDYSMASRTLLFDLEKKKWSKELLKATGIDEDKLSTPVNAGTIAGTINKAIIRELGLSPEIKVVVGTHDHICNAIGSGAVSYSDCIDTVGTTEGLTALMSRKQLDSTSIKKYQISCEPFVIPDIYNTVAWNNTSGILLKWFVEEFVKPNKNIPIADVFKELNEGMEDNPTRLLVLPHFSGAATPYMDEQSKGAILGLSLNTKAKDIYKALMEGANFELRLILECLKNAGLEVTSITATGGALSEQLLQIKADILGTKIHTVVNKQTGTLGGAILGTVANRDNSNLSEAVNRMVKRAGGFEPDCKRSRFYDEKMKYYKEMYQKIANINHNI